MPQGASPCAVVAVTSAEVGGCGYESHAEIGVLRAPGETRDMRDETFEAWRACGLLIG